MTLPLLTLVALPFLGSLLAACLPANARNAESTLAGLIALVCAVQAALFGARNTLHTCATYLDQNPAADSQLLARQARAQIEACAEHVIAHVGRALGAGPFCKDPQFARLSADLPVFLRQSHAERDLQVLGELAAQSPARHWPL